MSDSRQRRTRMADVAARAGVSQMTVSRAIRTPEKVAASTRSEINAAMTEFGYTPNLLAGGLAARHSGLISAAISTFNGAIFAETIAGMTETIDAAGLSILLGASGYSMNDEERLIRTILGRRPDGIFLTTTLHTEGARKLLLRSGVPIVEGWEIPTEPLDMAVGFDNRAAGYAMTSALLAAGYCNVAFIGQSNSSDQRGLLRRAGYRAALAERGLWPREVGSERHALDTEHGPELLNDLFAKFPDTEAVFCSFDMIAAGILLAANRRGLDVPGDLAVAGFGDFAIAKPSALDMTTVRIPGRTIGIRAGELLLSRIAGQIIPNTIIDVGFEVIRRSSA